MDYVKLLVSTCVQFTHNLFCVSVYRSIYERSCVYVCVYTLWYAWQIQFKTEQKILYVAAIIEWMRCIVDDLTETIRLNLLITFYF